MKKLYALAAAALCALCANAEQLTVFPEGSASSKMLPFNIYYASNNIHTQMIYPESALAQLKGKVIEKISFNITRIGRSTWTSPQLNVKMGSTAQNTYASATYIDEGLTEVAVLKNISLATSLKVGDKWEIALDKGYTYTGGNLVLDMSNVKGNGPNNWEFQCAAQSANTALSQSYSPSMEQLLPTMNIEYRSASESSAALSATEVNMGLVFAGSDNPAKVTLTNTGSKALSGSISMDNEAFRVEPASIAGLEAGQSMDLSVYVNSANAGVFSGNMTVSMADVAPITARLSATVVNAPEAIRTVFNKPDYAENLPNDWSVYAIEYFIQSGEISDSTTDYSLFPSVKFGSANIGGFNSITWVYPNPMGFTELYNRNYYLVSPKAGGRFYLGAAFLESLATDPYVKAFAATYNETTHKYEIGAELPITWDIAPDKHQWGYGSGTAPGNSHVALLIKYGALNYFASQAGASGISGITANPDAPARYYNLQGVEVTGHLTPGIYIQQRGTTTTKVLVR